MLIVADDSWQPQGACADRENVLERTFFVRHGRLELGRIKFGFPFHLLLSVVRYRVSKYTAGSIPHSPGLSTAAVVSRGIKPISLA